MNRAEQTNSRQIRLSLPHEPFAALPWEALTKSGYQAYIASLITVAAIYLVAAKLGLSLAFLNASVSPVWPPTGVAMAAVMLLGYQISPAIFVAALVANLATGLPIATATGIAAGNTLEAICAGFLLHRFVGFHTPFYRARDVLKFVLLAVLFSPMVSATIGNASLCLGGADHWANFWSLWLTWWIGDGVGALVVAPLVLTWVERSSERWPASRWAEGLLLLLALFAASTVLFREALPNNFVNLSLGRLIVPFLLWAAFRLGPRGVATAIAMYSGIAVWGTRLGLGPIVGQSPNDSLLLLQVSIAAIGITFLVVAGLVAERKRGENALSLLASIVESTDDGVMGIALDGTILSWNEGAERLHGYAADDVVGRSVAILIPPDRSEELPQILEQLGQGESIDRLETERLRKDGGIVLVSLTMSPIKDSGGQVIAASVIARDITRRRRAQRRLAGNLAIARILAESPALSDATPRILQTICETLSWEFGAMWAVDPDANVLRCLKVWHDPAEKGQGFEPVSYNSTFPTGVGLPGRVWASLKPAWIPDVARDSNFPRAPFAVAEGLHAAFAFPIVSGEKLMAVMEFFSNEIRQPDEAMLAMFESIGSQ
ncbi:MAG TPA: MASE1 domain-containing protein, partial [Blastocatellia bacterium]|nr:MASE1 domain-containing protein [Blastocatellia bacterium]